MINNTHKIRVAVLYGGRSGEHEVSLQSAASVIKNLDRDKYEIIPIGIDRAGHWLVNDIKQLPLDATTKSLVLQTTNAQPLAAPGQLSTRFCDVVFPVLHGTLGEDGTVQGLLELADLPYVGPGVLNAAIAMDKDMTKRLTSAGGVPVGPYLSFNQGQWRAKTAYYANLIATQLNYPVFIKPANAGSSVGIHKVKHPQDLAAKIEDAFQYDVKVLVEAAMPVREIEVAVLENPQYGADPLTSIPGEIVPQHEFYSYEAKYLDANGAELLIPAPLTDTQVQQAQQMAAQIFTLLECEGMARIDLFLNKQTNQFFFNEANTIPGFTQISMYPKLWQASGIAYAELLDRLIKLALARYQRKRNLKHDFAP